MDDKKSSVSKILKVHSVKSKSALNNYSKKLSLSIKEN